MIKYRTARTDWAFTDAEGCEWHEFPHGERSWGMVGYGPSEAMAEDCWVEREDCSVTVSPDALVTTDGDWPLDALMAVLARAVQWFDNGGNMPEGTTALPRKRVDSDDEDEPADDAEEAP